MEVVLLKCLPSLHNINFSRTEVKMHTVTIFWVYSSQKLYFEVLGPPNF